MREVSVFSSDSQISLFHKCLTTPVKLMDVLLKPAFRDWIEVQEALLIMKACVERIFKY